MLTGAPPLASVSSHVNPFRTSGRNFFKIPLNVILKFTRIKIIKFLIVQSSPTFCFSLLIADYASHSFLKFSRSLSYR
jgi:hypothetical protein